MPVQAHARGCMKEAEPSGSSRPQDGARASRTYNRYDGQQRREYSTLERGLSHDVAHLCPCGRSGTKPTHAHDPIQSQKVDQKRQGDAFLERRALLRPFECRTVGTRVAARCGGIDPGSKREGYSVTSTSHTYLNIQAEARDGVKEAEKRSTRMRRTRRGRNTPCRKPRQNRNQSKT